MAKYKKLCICAQCDKGIEPKNGMVMCTVLKMQRHSVTDCNHYKQK